MELAVTDQQIAPVGRSRLPKRRTRPVADVAGRRERLPVTPALAMWQFYSIQSLEYFLAYPAGWMVDEYGMSQATKEVIFSPPNAEPLTVSSASR